ncbi:MAG TPA: hypothetical protein VMV27_03935 [Candidatus Binataceae bacterium]|nr:hypothetical protein [Candidatus Binataceae bacterium]
MMTKRIVQIAWSIAMTLAVAGCLTVPAETLQGAKQTVADLTPKDVTTHSVRSIKTIKIDRIAVMPIIDAPPPGAQPLSPGAGDAITAELYSQAAMAGGWELIPQDDIVQAMQKMPPTTPQNIDQNALELGHLVSADGVLYGTVERYKERVGLAYASAEPASVTFGLKFVDTKSKQVVWTARFAKSQKALSQNIFNLVNFVQHSARWVRANEIAQEGVQQAVADLHGNLNLQENVKRFETGTYGELKSGQQRYNFSNYSNGLY